MDQALKSKTLNTIVLDSGLQISGILTDKMQTKTKEIIFLKFTGPVQLSFKDKQLKGHGKNYHKEGYSSPFNLITQNKKAMHLWTKKDLRQIGFKLGSFVNLKFKGGIQLKGQFERELRQEGKLLILTFKNCLITDNKNNLLYHPSWGLFDLAIGKKVTSAFSGPADTKAYQLKDEFEPSKIPQRKFTNKQNKFFSLYKEPKKIKSTQKLTQFLKVIQKQKNPWLLFLELLNAVKDKAKFKKQVLDQSNNLKNIQLQNKKVFKLGLKFYDI